MLLKDSIERPDGDQWEVIELPAILPSGEALWPEFWPAEELEKTRASMSVSKWNAQYLQNPVSEGAAIIKQSWWKRWEREDPPKCEYIIQSWDTAHTTNSRSDYSACTTWGVFYTEDGNEGRKANIILLNALQEKLEFPDLKLRAMQQYKHWEPDALIVEAKASGTPLIQEMRRMGIPIHEYSPSRGHDKLARINSISDLFSSGIVWCTGHRWAEELVAQVSEWPRGDHDDLVDSMTQALMRFRQGGFINLSSDEREKEARRRFTEYY